MDVKDTRRANLKLLIRAITGTRRGAQRRFAELTDIVPAHLSQMVSGSRAVGDTIARRIEENLNLEHGWMDNAQDTYAPPDGGQFSPGGPTSFLSRTPSQARGQREYDPRTVVERIVDAVAGVPEVVRANMLRTVERIAEEHHQAQLRRYQSSRQTDGHGEATKDEKTDGC